MNTPLDQLHHTQKVGFVLLSLFALCVLVLGAYQFRTIIYGPFAIAPTDRDADLAAIEDLFDEETRLQRIDTDQDGINDFEELYYYNTSPYLADTDSDGVSDYDEIFVYNTDPNCPSGADCDIYNGGQDNTEVDGTVGSSALLTGSVDTTETLLDAIASATEIAEGSTSDEETSTENDAIDFSSFPADIQETIEALTQNPEAIRELLRQSGSLSDEQIDSFSDELLIETVITLLNE